MYSARCSEMYFSAGPRVIFNRGFIGNDETPAHLIRVIIVVIILYDAYKYTPSIRNFRRVLNGRPFFVPPKLHFPLSLYRSSVCVCVSKFKYRPRIFIAPRASLVYILNKRDGALVYYYLL